MRKSYENKLILSLVYSVHLTVITPINKEGKTLNRSLVPTKSYLTFP